MIRYWAKDLFRNWNKRIAALFIVLSMLLPDLASFADTDSTAAAAQILTCGLVQHEHTDACYEEVQVPKDDTEGATQDIALFSVHHHSEACYDETGALICGMTDGKYYHHHTDNCRDEKGNLTCCLAENELYIEPETVTERRLICGLEEHVHGPECYTTINENNEIAEQPETKEPANEEETAETNLTDNAAKIDDQEQISESITDQEEHQITEENGESANTETETTITAENTESDSADTDNAETTKTEDFETLDTDTTDPEITELNPEAAASETTAPANTESQNTDTEIAELDNTTVENTIPENTDSETAPSTIGDPVPGNTLEASDNSTAEDTTADNSTSENIDTADTDPEEKPLFETNKKTLIRYNGNEEVVTVPKGIRKIEKKAFYGNKTIKTVILPNSVRVINSSAFAECSNLEQVVIGEKSRLELIGMSAFKNDKKLDISFATNVDRVVANAFEGVGEEETSEEELTTSEEEQEATDEAEEAEETEEEEEQEEQEDIEKETTASDESKDEEPTDNTNTLKTLETEETEETETTTEIDRTETNTKDEPTDQTEHEDQSETESETKPEDEPETELETETEVELELEPAEDEEETPEEETQNETELSISSAEDTPYQATITFSADAGIPEGTELIVTEPTEPLQPVPQLRSLRSAPQKAILQSDPTDNSPIIETEPAEEETYASIPSLTTWNEGTQAPDIILYQKILDISLVVDGEEIEPNPDAVITVSVILPEIEDGQEVEVRHITDSGSELLESTNNAGTITFTTGSFSLFEFTSSAQKIASKTSEWLENTLFGRSKDENATLETAKIDENSVPDGFSIIDTTSSPQNSNLWITLQRVKDIALGKLESIDLYAVVDGKLAGLVKENVGITDILRLNLGNYSSFALVRDSGLRSKVEELGNVVLSGLMPKNGVVEATDVTEEYENFLGGRGSDKNRETVEGHIEQGETVGDNQGESVGDTHTIAAYDISIKNDGEEYQPEDKPIEVTIKDEAIAKAVANGNSIELRHVIDENTAEQVTDFTVDGDTVTFSATGFSVYVVTETTVEKILTAADGKIYRITVTYDGSAQIPEGAELVVTEVDSEPYLTATATAFGTDESYLLYRKFLDISFIDADGAVVEPATPVQVKIELLDVDAGADKLQVVHFGETGAEKVPATANENAVVTFSAGEFSVYGFGNVLEPIDTVETDEASVEILGFGTETQVVGVDAPEVEEGLEVLAAYNLSDVGENKLWIKAELKEGVELTDMESVAVYSISSDETDGQNVAELAGIDTITELSTTEFAVIKDTGYRHLSFNLTPDEEGTKNVTLDGMMPKMATAEAADVTELYSTHEFTESAPIYNEETGAEFATVEDEAGEKEQGEAADDAGEHQEAADDHTTQRSTIAAFNITISNNSVDYQPDADHPVAVVITDERILPGSNLELWHIKDDGTEEKVENFSITTGTLSFTATGFSTYALVSTITTYYQTASGETYKITVEYGEDAGLSEGVELRITEVDGSDYLADTATALGTTDSYLLYRKFFDISFITTDEDGERIIEPNAPVNVTIELLDVTAGADKLQVVHFGETGAEKVTDTADENAVVSFTSSEFSVYGVGNVLETLATAETDEANIEILGFSGEAQINTADAPAVEEGLEVLGAYNLSNEAEKVWIKADVKDGVELSSMESVAIYTINDTAAEIPTEEQGDGESTGEEQTSEVPDEQPTEDQADDQSEEQGSVQSKAVENGLVTELVEAGTVAELNASNFALVKDSGYRHLNFEINVGGETAQAEGTEDATEQPQDEETCDATANVIILDGMMPKNAGATAVVVTDAYADHEYVVSAENTIDELNTEEGLEDGEEPSEELPVSDEEELQDSTEEHASDEETLEGTEEEQNEKRTTLAAYNITISNNDSEYQPDAEHPIIVEIRDRRIVSGENIELWHIKDDGTEERIDEFTVEEGRIKFAAQSFSVYAIIDHEDGTVITPRVEFHFISDKDMISYGTGASEYYQGKPYSFPNKHGDSQTTQILKDGESLELIKDPDNKFVEGQNKFFYGWYVVPSYTIDGITDEYGIGTADSKLYFTWPANPPMITFEQPISISADNNAGGSTAVNWNLDGVSGSGIPDNDGNIHVFLIPVFEKYSFVNFMLYAWNTAGISNMSSLMARKLIVMGTSDSVDVKISDVRSTSQDPVHLIFTGWAYNRGTDDNPNWEKILTVDSSGHEINEDQGGVYLTLDNLADDMSVDLYPIFVEARWVDFDIGVADNGASYVPSRYLHAWGMATPYGTQDVQTDGIHYFSKLDVSSRPGYSFDGWYAFAVRDEVTGEILNLNDPMDIQINYVDVNDKYSLKHVTIRTTAIKVTDENGNVIDSGTYSIEDDGQGHVSLLNSASGEKQFGTDNGQLKFYDPLEEMKLTAKWSPASSQITIVYWTEDAQGKEYTAPQDPKDDYTATAIKVITTEELNSQSAVIGESFYSGSTLTRNQLVLYQEGTIGVLDTAYLDEAGAVLAGEEKFYTRNDTLSDEQVVINGDGSTTINVYYSRMEFKLVFHIGRDGYVKTNGQQKPEFMTRPEYTNWDGNWIQFMFDDAKISNSPDDPTNPGFGYTPGPTAKSGAGVFSMTYNGRTYTSEYVTSSAKVKGDYVPDDSENVYVITAKYGAYIGDRWPTPVNNAFTFTNDPVNTIKKSMYIWAAYYGSLYCRIANERSNTGNSSGNNPDINGIYEYMSAELCSNRAGTDVINDNHVHHLVAWFGDKGKAGINKHYHIYYAAIEDTYDPADYPVIEPGSDYLSYNQTTWSAAEGNASAMTEYSFYKVKDTDVISNLEPQFQLITNLDGYDLVYSCYNTPQTNNHHIYFFFVPKQYTLTFNFGNTTKVDTYHYTRTLADADKYTNEVVIPEGYYFKGWYTNTAGAGDPFDFANETMPSKNLVLYPIISVLEYTVKIDPAGGVIDHRSNPQTSTYFYGNYGEPIGEYSVSRDYIELTEKEKDPNNQQYYTGTRYRYINTQFLEQSHEGTWGYPYDLRNAVYVAEDDIDTYYEFYCNIIDNADANWWEGITKLSKDAFLAKYSTDALYRPVNGEHYTFMGWYEVDNNGKVSNMPYNFNDPVSGPMELRAKWRLDGGFYLQYNPYYFEDDGQGNITAITGDIDQWHDPQDPHSQLYADQSPTQILHAPKNVLSTDSNNEWVFRGWRVVRANGTFEYENHTYIKWEPLQYENGVPVYYQPGQQFIVDASYATETSTITTGNVIHMQAYYERLESSDRRPDVTNLIIDANDAYDGYVNTSDSGSLPALSGPGTSYIDTENNLDAQNHPTQILLGDFQSNIALHLYQYATGTGTVHNGVPGANFFNHINGYKLIGFDENADPENPTTGHAYVPAFASDGVIAVTRNESKTKTIYAMWEPMVYVTFVNNTGGPISIVLTGPDTGTVSIVNEVTGEFDRQPASASIDLAAGDRVKVALPKATVTENAETSDTITATVNNDHLRRMISVSGEYPSGTAYGTGSTDIKYGSDVIYTGTLVVDPDGIVITYTEDVDAHIIYDVNRGTWTDTDPYEHLSGDNYTLDIHDIINNIYEPTEPMPPEGRVFLGWTIYPEIAAIHDFSSANSLTVDGDEVTIPEGSIQLDVVRDNYLWDFSRDTSELYENDKTLYAVWSDTVTVQFNIVYSQNMSLSNSGITYHTWNGPVPETVFDTDVFYQNPTDPRFVTYTLAKGDKVSKPEDPSPHTDVPTWKFMYWLIKDARHNTDQCRYNSKNPNDDLFATNKGNIFDFTQRVLTNTELVTSWTASQPQTFTFTIKNEVVNCNPDDEFEYTIAVDDDYTLGKMNIATNEYGHPTTRWGSVTTKLKNNEEYTVTVTVYKAVGISWNAYNTEIKVTDRNGTVIKDGKLFYCKENSVKDYVSDYKYSMTVVQSPAAGYTTNVITPPESQVGTFTFSTNDDRREFEFGSKRSVNSQALDKVHNVNVTEEFRPERNTYEMGSMTNSLTVIFRNTAIVAPTGFTAVTRPFVLMLLAGLLLLAGIAVPIFVRKRRHVKAETCEVVQINDPGPIPPCLKANLWEEEPPGKRGDTG